ncbi:MAG: acyl-CoA thioesterase [Lachnospiraceae bacterium]|nr:acyl-CoA thioesterase [Lachnospiraceae bacterium]
MKKEKYIKDSMAEQSYIVRAQHINGYGRLFGGILVQWIDEIAGIVAKRHAEAEVTTVAIDNIYFKRPAYSNDIIVLVARVTYVGRSSMEVRVDTYTEALNGTRKVINRAYVVMVAIDKDGHALEVPGLILENEQQKWEWESGKKRYQLRKERSREGY